MYPNTLLQLLPHLYYMNTQALNLVRIYLWFWLGGGTFIHDRIFPEGHQSNTHTSSYNAIIMLLWQVSTSLPASGVDYDAICCGTFRNQKDTKSRNGSLSNADRVDSAGDPLKGCRTF